MRKCKTMAYGLMLMLGASGCTSLPPAPAAGGGVPEASAAADVDHGVRAELDPAARSDYFALRAGIQRLTAQLEACQARLR
ncbi:lysis system i-spanin subunit Rz [Achromobacter ruhlandii]|uniref:lysis system i-spanin subunit Rz n=1 Tax=Achromobacter ruhlandii TaxID=72557 RepID=UPI0028A89C05|nr:lysis system i-spanin subunit Rz [Achromobacter ruhlandii]